MLINLNGHFGAVARSCLCAPARWERLVTGLVLVMMITVAAAGEIRVGSSAALTGPASALGTRFHAGAAAYFSRLNAQGGVNGATVVVDLRDDGYEPDRTEANTRQLVADDRIVALFGYVGTPTSNVALPYVRRYRIPFVGAYTGADLLRHAGDAYIFNVRASYDEEAEHLAAAMKQAGVRTLNVLYQYDSFGRAGLEAMKKAAEQKGISVVATSPVERNTENVAADVDALVLKSASDAIYMVSTYGTCAAFIKAAREAGYKGRFHTLSFAGLEPLRKALQGRMQGVTVAQVVPNAQDPSRAIVADYQTAMRATGDMNFDSISLEGYIAARVMIEGLRKSRPPISRDAVALGLEAMGNRELGGFRLELGPGRHNASSFIELVSER